MGTNDHYVLESNAEDYPKGNVVVIECLVVDEINYDCVEQSDCHSNCENVQ